MPYRLKMTVGMARIALVVSVLLAAGLCTEWWLARQAS
jgi:hypothetical protein